MTVPGKRVALLVGFFFILISPPLASGKSRKSGADGGIFFRDYDDGTLPFENATKWRKLKIINRNEVN